MTGYWRLADLDIALRRVNVLIGANGVGKSSVLDVIDLLAAAAGGNLQSTITNLGGMGSLLTADGKTNTITLAVETEQANAAPLRYQIDLAAESVGYLISHEALSQQRDASATIPFKYIDASGPHIRCHHDGKFHAPDWEHKPQETALSQVPRTYREAEAFRRLLADDISEIYHGLDVSARSPVKTPQTISPAKTPGVDGGELVSRLYTIRETARDLSTPSRTRGSDRNPGSIRTRPSTSSKRGSYLIGYDPVDFRRPEVTAGNVATPRLLLQPICNRRGGTQVLDGS